MGIRMSGLSSGMDTEAIVKELMSAQSMKKNKVVKAKTKLEWTQTKWSELNTKLTGLYNNFVSKMQLSTAYKTKKTTVSDATKASVAAKTAAANGSYSMEIKNIATSQYLTGAKIDASASDKLTDIDSSLLNKEISITVGAFSEQVIDVIRSQPLAEYRFLRCHIKRQQVKIFILSVVNTGSSQQSVALRIVYQRSVIAPTYILCGRR